MKQIDLNRMSELLNGFIAEDINKQEDNYENGDIENITILDGHKFLQNATIEAINEAAKSFPKTNQSIEIQIPIEYKII